MTAEVLPPVSPRSAVGTATNTKPSGATIKTNGGKAKTRSTAHSGELAADSHAIDDRLAARIDALVSAIGGHLQQGHSDHQRAIEQLAQL